MILNKYIERFVIAKQLNINSHVCNAWLMIITSQTTTTNVAELQLQHRF
jgi:hypothetical protein